MRPFYLKTIKEIFSNDDDCLATLGPTFGGGDGLHGWGQGWGVDTWKMDKLDF